jgi:hypothetical protein
MLATRLRGGGRGGAGARPGGAVQHGRNWLRGPGSRGGAPWTWYSACCVVGLMTGTVLPELDSFHSPSTKYLYTPLPEMMPA